MSESLAITWTSKTVEVKTQSSYIWVFRTKIYHKVISFTNVAAYFLNSVRALVKGYRSLQIHGWYTRCIYVTLKARTNCLACIVICRRPYEKLGCIRGLPIWVPCATCEVQNNDVVLVAFQSLVQSWLNSPLWMIQSLARLWDHMWSEKC